MRVTLQGTTLVTVCLLTHVTALERLHEISLVNILELVYPHILETVQALLRVTSLETILAQGLRVIHETVCVIVSVLTLELVPLHMLQIL